MPSVYRPHRPRTSPLWQLVHHYWSDFESGYEKRHRPIHGPLRRDAIDVMRQFYRCGGLAAGFTRLQQKGVLCLTHNLMVLLEEDIRRVERIDNASERKRKARRKETAEKKGANYIVTALQRFTVKTLKFIRWLRNFVYRETSWETAVARLRRVYAVF